MHKSKKYLQNKLVNFFLKSKILLCSVRFNRVFGYCHNWFSCSTILIRFIIIWCYLYHVVPINEWLEKQNVLKKLSIIKDKEVLFLMDSGVTHPKTYNLLLTNVASWSNRWCFSCGKIYTKYFLFSSKKKGNFFFVNECTKNFGLVLLLVLRIPDNKSDIESNQYSNILIFFLIFFYRKFRILKKSIFLVSRNNVVKQFNKFFLRLFFL